MSNFFPLYIFCTNGTCKYDHIDRESEIDLPPLFLEKATLIFALNIYDTHTHKEYVTYYDWIFALVAKMTIVRMVLSIATFNGWSLYQMDLKNVFLRGDLTCSYIPRCWNILVSGEDHCCRISNFKLFQTCWF